MPLTDWTIEDFAKRKEPLLLLSCCAPCTGGVMKTLGEAGIDYTVLFYNPNIHPEEEYLKRKDEQKDFADKLGTSFVDLDYDTALWFEAVKGLENEPEKGKRCSACFAMRLARAAAYAADNSFGAFSSTLGISRFKDFEQVNRAASSVLGAYPALSYWAINWRKNGGSMRMDAVAKEENFYRQDYCGCVFSKERHVKA